MLHWVLLSAELGGEVALQFLGWHMSVDTNQIATGSVTQCLDRAKQGESLAQHQLWERYLHRLIGLSRHRLHGFSDGMTEPEDMALVVFNEFFQGVERRQFTQLDSRDDLWQVLVMLTNRRCIDQRRQAHAVKRQHVRLAVESRTSDASWEYDCIEQLVSTEPTPEEAALLAEGLSRRLAELGDERLVEIAKCKLSGHTNLEIAGTLKCSTRSVERKLSIIRRRWMC